MDGRTVGLPGNWRVHSCHLPGPRPGFVVTLWGRYSLSLVGVDVGGTFTDVVSIEGGDLTAIKVPTNVGASELSVLEGAEEAQVSRARVFNLASTAGLNAVITRALPKVAFLTTIGPSRCA